MEKKKTKKKTKIIITLCVVAALVVTGVAYALLKPDEKLAVETVTATSETIYETLDTTGTVNADSQDTFSLIDGVKVSSVNVKEGDTVNAGQVIATFDTSSLQEAINQKESTYLKAKSAYDSAVKSASDAKSKVSSVKKQVSELEKSIKELEEKTEKETTTTKKAVTTTTTKASVTVSDSLVKRFVKVAKLLGVEYSNDAAKKILTNLLSSGSSVGDLSSFMDNLDTIAGTSGSFDMSALSGMSTSSTALVSAEMSLVQLKAQLATLELQSDSTYVSTFKTIADKAKQSYTDAQSQADVMKKGWVATGKGIVSEVNITEGQMGTTSANSSSSSTGNVDISSILSAVTSGGDMSSLISSFFDNSATAVKILYYPLVADISLSKYDVLNANLNQDVTITSASGAEFDGKVSYISPVANSSDGSINISSLVGSSGSSSSIPAQVTIQNADRSIIVGVDVDISIITNTAENAIAVPVEAICIDGSDQFVYVYDKDKSTAVRKDVKLGISDDKNYQVLSGVKVGDVLIKNTSGLEDGSKVSVS